MVVSAHVAPRVGAKVAYGALFVVLVPALLVALAAFVRVPFPAVHHVPAGLVLVALGLGVTVSGMLAIVRRGRGLPMNAFPPERLVTDGVFGVVPHPIYTGFVAACAGLAVATGSAAGLWVATPVAALGCLALVWGHERLVLHRRFGALPDPLLGPGRLRPLADRLGLTALVGAGVRATERLANSWSARRYGPVRVMNHVVFSGLAGGVGAAIVVLASGAEHTLVVAGLMVAGTIGAAIVGQLLVGSSGRLSRPFGYFGGLAAIAVLGGAWALARPADTVVLAAFALAAPWTQAIGRLRCLVQGCCHGAPTDGMWAITVTNPHSRVCALAGLAGVPIHHTQLYSLLGNLLLGPALLGLWVAGAPLSLVMGGYLIGAGVVRFIEEAHRGEPLTPIVRGLHVYQWFSVAMYVAGVLVLLVPTASAPPLTSGAWPAALAVGAVFFVVCGAALSVDLPESTARFSRLSG